MGQRMANVKTFKELEIWQLGIDLVTNVYKITRTFPREEIYGLSSQMRRCAISVPSNIAEGSARNSVKEFIQFLSISLGSIAELETQLIIAKNLNYINHFDFDFIDKLKRKILYFIKYLKNK